MLLDDFCMCFSAKEISQTKGGVKSKRITKTLKNGANPSSRPTTVTQSNIKHVKHNDWPPSPVFGASPNSLTPGGGGVPSNTSPPLAAGGQTNGYPSTTRANSQANASKKLDKLKRKQQSKLNSAAKEAAVAHTKSSSHVTKSEKERHRSALMAAPLRWVSMSLCFLPL